MSYVRLWVHVVFSTRDRHPYLSSEIRNVLYKHIKENCQIKEIYLDSIGGWSEHVHMLVSLGREQTVAKLMMLIKGESAHWLNQQNIIKGKIYWQDDYYAISVSESQVEEVRRYIRNQETHHKAVPYEREVATLEKIFRR